MDKSIITSYKDLDMDGYASAVGYQELLIRKGQNTEAVSIGKINTEIQFVLSYLKQQAIRNITSFERSDKIFLVDASELEATEIAANEQQLQEIIDHHIVNKSHLYPWAKIQIEPIGACATLIVEKFRQSNLDPLKNTATMLYAGIISNTINLKNKITTDRDRQAATYLKKLAMIPDDFTEKMFEAKSDLRGDKLKQLIATDYYERNFLNYWFGTSQVEVIGIKKLVQERLGEVKKIIKNLASGQELDFLFLNLIDILSVFNIIIAFNNQTEDLLGKVLGIKFDQGIAETDHIIMRKEIMAKIKEYLEKK